MNYHLHIAAVLVAVGLAAPAAAVTITTSAVLPTEATPIGTPAASGGSPSPAGTLAYYENVTGHQFVGGTMVARDVWQGTGLAGQGVYSSVSGNSFAEFEFDSPQVSLSFVWGSPDNYNDLVLSMMGNGSSVTVNGTAIEQPPSGQGALFVTIAGFTFDKLRFESRLNAFEFANLSTTPIPLPAAGWMLIAALGGLGLLSRKRAAA